MRSLFIFSSFSAFLEQLKLKKFTLAEDFMKDNESELFKKYRVVNQITSPFPLMIQSINETVHIISVTPTSYNIYDTKKMNLVFCGPVFNKIHCAYQRNGVVYIGSYRTVYATARGEVTKTFLLPRGPAQSNKRLRISEEMEEDVIQQITGFGGIILILTAMELIVTEDLEEIYRIDHDQEVTRLFHPHTYINKVIKVMKDGKMALFNISSRKEIYSYKPFDSDITAIEQTPVVDVVGVGLRTGMIHVFNLKTDKVLFSFKVEGAVSELSFGENHFIAITDNGMFIFDLNEKKKIISRENSFCIDGKEGAGAGDDGFYSLACKDNVLSGRFLDEKSLIVSTGNSLTIYEMNNYNLELIKRRKTYNDEVIGIEFIDRKNVILFGPRNISCINLYKDEQNFEFKFKGSVEMMDVSGNIVCFGKKSLYSLEFSEKKSKFILNKDINCLAVYKDFCCFGKGSRIVLVNLKSKLVHSKFKTDGELVDLAMDFTKIVAATSSGIYLYTLKGVLISKYEQVGVRAIRLMENFVIASMENQVLFYDEEVSRVFKMTEDVTDYCVSRDLRWIAVLCKRKVFVYDILTTALLDMLTLAEEGKFVRFSPKLDFLLVVFEDNDLVLFSNKSYFLTSIKPEEVATNFSDFKKSNEIRETRWERIKSNFYMELLLLRGLSEKEAIPEALDEEARDMSSARNALIEEGGPKNSGDDVSAKPEELSLYRISPETLNRLLDQDWIRGLNKEQVLKIMDLILPHMSTSMEIIQKILFNLLKYKSHLLEPKDIYSFHERFDKEWTDFEQNSLKTIGYLNMEINGLL